MRDKEKQRIQNKLYRETHKEYFKLHMRQWQKDNREKVNKSRNEYYWSHRDEILEKNRLSETPKIYRRNHPDIDRIRRLKRRQRVPSWANLDYIKEIYANCPKEYHVDHIVPLNGKIVSGLHVEYNLQYLTPQENMAKKNIFPHPEYHV